MHWNALVASVAGLILLPGCAGQTTGGHCTSHYEPIANAATKPALKRELVHDVDPRVRSLRLFTSVTTHHKLAVNLLNRRQRSVMSLDMWQRDDGTWTAQQWSQCID